nr:radical SAM protein [uncultured Pseudodesulfovibrio sp.]
MEPTIAYVNHPCFGISSRKKVGRIHLPVAPRANARIKFASTDKPSSAIMPADALNMLTRTIEAGNPVGIVGITGPGDPMAVPEYTLETLRLVREKYPDMPLCLTTIGIGCAEYAEELAKVGVMHVSILVDAVTPEVADTLYAWIRPAKHTMPLSKGVEVLLNEQARAVIALKKAGITVKINTTVYPGYNAGHVEEIAATMAALGADIMAIVPYRPEAESVDVPNEPDMELIATVCDRAARHMNLMPLWDQCGEKIVGLREPEEMGKPSDVMPKPTAKRPNVAVASSNGMEVDLHLGHASTLLIYGPREDGLACLLETRQAPDPGAGSSRWEQMGVLLEDCFALLTSNAGEKPRKNLSRLGVSVVITDGEVEGTVDMLFGGGKKKGKCRK